MTTIPLPQNCLQAKFISRYKRFSVQVQSEKKAETHKSPEPEIIWVHSNNSGSMLGLTRSGTPILISPATNPKRKLAYTQEAMWLGQRHLTDTQGFWVGVNTSIPNKMLAMAFAAENLPFAQGYTKFTPEAKYGQSRIDALLEAPDRNLPKLWVECKNVTLVEDGIALFPDAVTTRGQKHLRELIAIVATGQRAANFYLIQRPDANCFAPADMIDPDYAQLFYQAQAAGVEMYPFVAEVNPQGITLGKILPVQANHMQVS